MLTNNKYQSRFLPILSRAETDIKELIIKSALLLKGKAFLRLEIRKIVARISQQLPSDLIDRQAYIEGLMFSSERMIKKYYDQMILSFLIMAFVLMKNGVINKIPKTQLELVRKAKNTRKTLKPYKIDKEFLVQEGYDYKIDVKFETKGTPNVEDYARQLKQKINGLAKEDFAPAEEGKRKITIWQKAELDLRHENQMKMLEGLVESGIQYAWTSTHPDCSKRCEKWQGKLFDLVNDAEVGKFKMKKKIEGHTVYSFKAVASQVDKYGYTNNIIVGFNCRHKLVPFTPKSEPPTEYNAEEVKKNREINAKLRAYEREIRRLKRLSIFYKTIDPKQSKMYLEKAKELTKEYKGFAKANGYAWLEYRLEV